MRSRLAGGPVGRGPGCFSGDRRPQERAGGRCWRPSIPTAAAGARSAGVEAGSQGSPGSRAP